MTAVLEEAPAPMPPVDHDAGCLCSGSGWVCEDHPYNPFGFGGYGSTVTCWCDAPGMRCPGRVVCVCGHPVSTDFVRRRQRTRHLLCTYKPGTTRWEATA